MRSIKLKEIIYSMILNKQYYIQIRCFMVLNIFHDYFFKVNISIVPA